ncbi:MAG: polyphosphate polymerase domain-containing protein [Ruminiclostridium sp.]|nr:polyphosphate polymerase domain-containing protein [Ruminiclostridium sp.]
MKSTDNIIYRNEIKYRINGAAYHILRGRLGALMQPDLHAKNGMYRVTSLYFDDIYRSAYFDKINGALRRKKYRIRAYDLSPDVIHLEEKVKHNSVGYKKSISLTREQYRSILNGDYSFLADECYADSSGGDMFASNSAAHLSPAVIVDYIREPFTCAAGNVRVTFDMKISACTNGYDMFDGNCIYEDVMPDKDIVLEVKYDNYIPEYIMQVLSGISTLQESVSKYVLCIDKLNQRYYC